ncbi:hypothetical protein [Aestuariibius sp. HNIBRBA575]|uniref:hypothetical protein n=1 Tax=Aestuariibius sp. HNIBRBA575 TaxID=3233343 RepID=UPI0034A4C9E4
MTEFQVLIVNGSTDQEVDGETGFYVDPHSKSSERVIAGIEALSGVWDEVVEKLTHIADRTKSASENSDFEMKSVEFNIGIEAGLSIGLVTKGEASVSVVFEKK